jgi:hypothetical protein
VVYLTREFTTVAMVILTVLPFVVLTSLSL